MVKKRACIFISGSGTNLRSIIKSSRDYNFPIKINLVISNKANAKGIIFAKRFSIPYIIFDLRKKNDFEKLAFQKLKDEKIELICLAGFMQILSKNFIRSFKGKIINIHPSLLPKYKGLNTFDRAIKAGEKVSGCTVHFVDEKLDNGRVILKKRVKICKSENEQILKKKVQNEEHRIYSMAIRKIYI